jgi:hypothetical protein
MFRLFLATCIPLLLAACASGDTGSYRTASASPSGPSVISSSGAGGATGPMIAGPAGCAGPIAEYQQIIDSDAETGHLNPGVYNRVSTDLEPVKRACAEGREADARNQLASVKARYGYR